MVLALNNLQMLICHKTTKNKQTNIMDADYVDDLVFLAITSAEAKYLVYRLE